MVPASAGESSVFGIDSKIHTRTREEDGRVRELFRANIGVALNPLDPISFPQVYDEILDGLFSDFDIERKRRVYKSKDIVTLLSPRDEKVERFHLAFARKILNREDIVLNVCYTQLNSKHLTDGKVKIYGRYGSPTIQVDVKKFVDIIDSYYNVVCAWKIIQKSCLKGCQLLFDGMDKILVTKAWDNLSRDHQINIVYGGDRVDPILSSADLILRFLDLYLKKTRGRLDEKNLEKIITYEDKVHPKNKYYHYIGNPDLDFIKPEDKRPIVIENMTRYLRRPIVFVSAGTQPKQRAILENLPIFDKIYDKASEMQGSVRVFDPHIDSKIIGHDKINCDYFISLSAEADEQFDLLKRGGANIEELKI